MVWEESQGETMRYRLLAVIASLVFVINSFAAVPTFSDYYVFGDSLSDTGNVLKVSMLKITEDGNETYNGPAKYPGPTVPKQTSNFFVNNALFTSYNQTLGRFTDGADTRPATNILGVWHEQLAPKMGLAAATPSTSGGKNYAFGGAETKAGQTTITSTRGTASIKVIPTAPIDNIGKQVDDYTTYLFNNDLLADSNALYIIWGGGNDVLNTADNFKAKKGTLDDIAAAGVAAVNNLKGYIKQLYDKGARKFLWPNLPPIGSIPEYKKDAQELKDKLAATCDQFKTDETAAITQLMNNNAGLSITQLDILGLFNAGLQNPAAYGFDNVDSPVRGTSNNPDKYVFWDTIHPTTRTDTLIANAAADALGIPEPASIGLVVLPCILFRRAKAA